MSLTLIRTYKDDVTLGELYAEDGNFICYTLELPNKSNKRQSSCIPEGKYKFHKKFSQKLNWVYELEKVPERSLIYIHSGNTVLDIKGCILIGETKGKLTIDHKVYPAVLDSRKAMTELFKLAGNEGFITITTKGA